jgi:hypothetical protein
VYSAQGCGRHTWLDTPIRRRKAIANASGLGLAVEELTPLDDKACAEMAALVRTYRYRRLANETHDNCRGTGCSIAHRVRIACRAS